MSYLYAFGEQQERERAADSLSGQQPFDPSAQPAPFTQGFGYGAMEGGVTGIEKAFQYSGELGIGLAGSAADLFGSKAIQKELEDESLNFERNYQDFLYHSTLDPRTIGFAGKVVGGVAQQLPTLIVAGPVGVGFGGAEETMRSLGEQGVSEGLATTIGVIEGGAQAAIGAYSPSFIRGLIPRLGFGAISNTAFGSLSTEGQKLALEAAGYPDVAKQFSQNPEQLSSDFLTGLLFGALEHFIGGGRARDALTVLKKDDAFRNQTPLGKPADDQSAILHQEAMLKAAEDVVRGEPIEVPPETANAHFVEDPAQGERTQEAAETVKEIAKEEGIKESEPKVRPVPDLILADVGSHPLVPETANESAFERSVEAPKEESKTVEAPKTKEPETKTTPQRLPTLEEQAKQLGVEPEIEFPDGQVLSHEDAIKRAEKEADVQDLLAKATKAVSECYLDTLT